MMTTSDKRPTMTVNQEIKSGLAKLLAMENIVVEHRNVETASFDVQNRILVLPMWKYASEDVYDMLVGHEVGHALHTPDRNWIAERKIPPQFVNIVEDVRIEKKIKERYVGIVKNFNRAYKELHDQDFFQIKDDDLDDMNLADRVNLHFKIGMHETIPFSEEELNVVKRIDSCNSFDDVLDAAEELYLYCKQKIQNNQQVNLNPNQSSNEPPGAGDVMEVENQTQDSKDDDSEEGDADQKDLNQQPDPSSHESDEEFQPDQEPEAKTMNAFEESMEQLMDKIGSENVYLEVPDINVDDVIIDNQLIHDNCKDMWEDIEHEERWSSRFEHIDNAYQKFKSSAKREVSYLIKEFECRKSADAYARSSISRTGVLDCSKLHTYKYNEDLFKKVTTFSDGKNHGLVFVLDWSGSMGRVLLDTVKQLFNLIWFCKRESIPFEVYAFTCEFPKRDELLDEYGCPSKSYEERGGLIEIPEWFSLMNMLTHTVNSKVLDDQMKNIWRIAYSFSTWYDIPTPVGMSLSGTPLNETMISLDKIIPAFRKRTKVQKVQCIVLTDGEAQSLKYHVDLYDYRTHERYLGRRGVKTNCMIRNRKNGKTYSLNVDWNEQVDVFLRYLRDNHPDVNFIGFRLLESRDAGNFIRNYCGYYGDLHDSTMSSWRKSKSVTITTSGYHKYFGISTSAVSDDSKFTVPDDATKAQIKTAFMKNLNSKKTNKKILREFVELIA